MLKIVLALFFMSLNAQASDPWFEKGNGGFGISCQDKALVSFDLFEAQHRYGLIVDHNANQDVPSRFNYLLSKLNRLNGQRAALYKQWFESFYEDTNFTEVFDEAIPDDFGFAYLPKGCQFVPVVIQRPRSRTDIKRYTIRLATWNRLDTESRAALILHEIIYREGLEDVNIHFNSEYVRYFNALINSTSFETLSLKDYFEFLQRAEFANADYMGYPILLGYSVRDEFEWKSLPFEFYDKDHLKSATMSSVDALDNKLALPLCDFEGAYSLGTIHFLPSGVLDSIQLDFNQSRFCNPSN